MPGHSSKDTAPSAVVLLEQDPVDALCNRDGREGSEDGHFQASLAQLGFPAVQVGSAAIPAEGQLICHRDTLQCIVSC